MWVWLKHCILKWMKWATLHKAVFATVFAVVLAVSVSFTVDARPYGSGKYGVCNYDSGCSISISTSGAVALPVTPTALGAYTTQKDSVTITTDDPVGYTLGIESLSGSSSALIKGSDTIPSVSGTPSSPASLSSNTWGYRIDGQASFGTGPTAAVTNAASSGLSFAGVPLGGSMQQIYTSNTPASAGNTINVWYGIYVNTTKPAGTYQQTVLYTATATP